MDYGKYDTGERFNVDTSIDTSQFGDIMMVAYNAAVMEAPRLDAFGIGIGGSIYSDIIKVGNALYFGGMDKRFYCVSDDGKELWTFPTNHNNGTPVIDGDRLYFGSFDNNLYCLSLEGKLIWKFETKGKLFAKPCITPKGVVFGSYDRNFYCVSREGKLLWTYKTQGPITADPILYKNLLYVSSDDHVLHVLDLDGRHVRRITSNGAFSSPIIVDDVIYVGCFGKNFYAFTLGGEETLELQDPGCYWNPRATLLEWYYLCLWKGWSDVRPENRWNPPQEIHYPAEHVDHSRYRRQAPLLWIR